MVKSDQIYEALGRHEEALTTCKGDLCHIKKKIEKLQWWIIAAIVSPFIAGAAYQEKIQEVLISFLKFLNI